ncbi:TetR/AcrR family transcriptional regulator [Agrobacterium rosae]|uniref:Copper outer membrane regulator n=1 Tax=Agrobacterium rosae TaxID=1972867 RepID=A0A1R3U0G5_9HYPH|nr:TetR/AcrR family transcriptional regulator [Agrobacterium rosae]KAA3509266.1 TetR/AcrR family transcriptional regulator [Agrobacterium rosae]KAA3513963.1 TetR/AcrR family transcriptional regulator [Agrobacterium rosae]MBN7808652.1 TetR/AcrR family transcriptional regulator [Agrobacterium rosae]MCM2435578.1 TetR/AcrR family transcriptional regulator [Agrobacterium rosae]MDX8304734.1 TetR/AcrR family transcriptional regulator [Agrobacterium rosae]
MDKVSKKRRGGPRTFDRDQAVDTAMRLFWRHGYEGVSLNDLTSAIGIAPPSIYAAFGSKTGLYREALDRYFEPRGVQIGSPASMSLTEAIDRMLRNAVDAVTDPAGELGCMISSGMIQCAPDHAALAAELSERRREMRDAISTGLQRWLDHDRAGSLARFLATILQGLSVQARDGATREQLYQVVSEAVAGVRATIGSPGIAESDN